jgi:uridine kinase
MLIDGRSGSGKTELAAAIAVDNPEVQLLGLDDVYPGWDGLLAGSAAVHETVLPEHRWRRWDWAAASFAEWHELDPDRPLIIEGCGALSSANRALAHVGVWVELDTPTRKERAIARDGETFAGHWDEWAAQEETFIARERPRTLADITVAGDAPVDLAFWRSVLSSARVES